VCQLEILSVENRKEVYKKLDLMANEQYAFCMCLSTVQNGGAFSLSLFIHITITYGTALVHSDAERICPFTGAIKRKSAILLYLPRPWANKYIPYGREPAPDFNFRCLVQLVLIRDTTVEKFS
jgi:hypothetical protein